MLFILLATGSVESGLGSARRRSGAPYPPSPVLAGIAWQWNTLRTAAPGSDCWPVAWAADGDLYTAWGDGGGFGGTDSDGRVALGFARIHGAPESYRAANVNGGRNPEHPASFPRAGKADGLTAVGATLYAWINLQNGSWPAVDEALAWSADAGATWTRAPWVFSKGPGRLKPTAFLGFGRAYSGVPAHLDGYVYFYGVRQGMATEVYLGRVPTTQIAERAAYRFYAGPERGGPAWSDQEHAARPVFRDAHGIGDVATVVYHPILKRYVLTAFHKGPGQLGVFDAPEPWGPWTTVAYYDDWGKMGSEGDGLDCSFPAKWMSADGLSLWCVFSVYGKGGKMGVNGHDRFNLVKATLILRSRGDAAPSSHGMGPSTLGRPDRSMPLPTARPEPARVGQQVRTGGAACDRSPLIRGSRHARS